MEQVRGIITRVLKREENGRLFAVVRYESGLSLVEAKISGFCKDLAEGHYFVAAGEWRESPANGRYAASRVLYAKSIQPDLPTSTSGAVQWLAGMFNPHEHGASRERIEALVRRLGDGAAHACEGKPDLLLGITANPDAYRAAIFRTWGRAVSGRQAFRLMEAAGLDRRTSEAIYAAFLDRTNDVVLKNPYQASRVKNVGFGAADKIGRHVKIGVKDDRRVAAALVDSLEASGSEGSTFASVAVIGERMEAAYQIDTSTAAEYMVRNHGAPHAPFAIAERQGEMIAMLREFRDGETAIAKGAVALLRSGRRNDPAKVKAVAAAMFASDKNSKFDDIQRAAVVMAMTEPFCVLTGGPGTGKSTVSQVVVAGAKRLDGGEILLCAPTGKAAKRLEETTGEKARTIHRLLEATADSVNGRTEFKRGKTRPLSAGCVVIVDESSMIDVHTMRALVEAMPPDGRLILVGDRNQLPSVDAGAVLADILAARNASGELLVPATELVNVYRQSRNSAIATGASEVRQGRLPPLSKVLSGGVVMFETRSESLTQTVMAFVRDVCTNPRMMNLRPHQFAVLTPQKKGVAGTWELNREMSLVLNPKGKAIPGVLRGPNDDPKMPVPRVGDRVMQTENDNENDIMNGDVGTIVAAESRKMPSGGERPFITVRFDSGREVGYPAGKWRSLILAYAMTIHKSQGSQYHTVIMPQTMEHSSMLDRSLLYTGWTRATDILCLIGEREALEKAVSTTDASRRDTMLGDYLGAAANAAGLRGRLSPVASPAPVAVGVGPAPEPSRMSRQPVAPPPAAAGVRRGRPIPRALHAAPSGAEAAAPVAGAAPTGPLRRGRPRPVVHAAPPDDDAAPGPRMA